MCSYNVNMRHLLFGMSFLALGALAGCTWPPDSTPVPYTPRPYLYYNVHCISQRSVSGVESVVTIVLPYESYYYGAAPESDSLRYILVNGDTAFRHPTISSSIVYDSAAPYKIDGSENIVELVYPSISINDTSYVTDLNAQITSPPYGDTILRTSDAIFGYSTSLYSAEFQVSDSLNFYPQSIDAQNYNNSVGLYSGAVDIPVNEMEIFRPGTLWADLTVSGTIESNVQYKGESFESAIQLDRIIAYPLR
jgi:hypothetical protein